MSKVRVTVAKLAVHEDLIEKHLHPDRLPDGLHACDLWNVGQEFIIENWPGRPDDFTCDWAWSDIQRDVAMIMFGANPFWMAKEGATMTCCSDGFRPVSFLIERIED